MEGFKVNKPDIGINRRVDEVLLIFGDVHVRDCPGYLLGINGVSWNPVVGIPRVEYTNRLLARAVVQVSFRCEAAPVNTRLVDRD